MPFAFNQKLWNLGRQIEDATLPVVNDFFKCDFKRNENNIWDVLDFRDEDKKIIVEVKGRTTPHDEFDDTIITASKVTSGFQAIEGGYQVYFVFAFSDKTMYIELKSDASFKCKFTGSNCVRHYLIPVKDLIDLPTETEVEDPEPEETI
tara:strand:- start:101 stop:547 length:447 start_codon:yes stop_codon:yes gene_type:complete